MKTTCIKIRPNFLGGQSRVDFVTVELHAGYFGVLSNEAM